VFGVACRTDVELGAVCVGVFGNGRGFDVFEVFLLLVVLAVAGGELKEVELSGAERSSGLLKRVLTLVAVEWKGE
jgi:hypothetical protein